MSTAQSPCIESAEANRCATCGATSAVEAWNMCNAGGKAVCYGITLFPVDVQIGRIECGAVRVDTYDDALDSTQKSE
ncbi:hypothetical protein [Ralstonia pseudosolanacearum]|uniref:hypothetical protein n=1 Tax=Ralstonia pseudosolanacearum TaxID=1310165 RepID=UPI003CEA2592